jgi:23S rRNA (uridine2552-2'-O)-methyltransferase
MGSAGILSDRRGRHDAFFQRAQRENFAARAVYKLQEIDERYGLFRPGQRVLDLGCRPGSWLQYAGQKVGSQGCAYGNRPPAAPSYRQGRAHLGGRCLRDQRDELRGTLSAFDVVLSDMAPDTTGIRHVDQARSEGLFERAVDLAEELLSPGGHFLGKLFQGPDFQRLRARLQAGFSEVRVVKPDSSRKESIELYLLALRRKAPL